MAGKSATYTRWSNTYARQLIREDIRDLTDVRSVTAMETLFHLLPSKVGNPLSAAGMARDLQVSPVTVQNWLALFERFFLTFSIAPWTVKIARAVLMVALELWRAVASWNDLGLGDFGLHFIKNKEKQEVDFLLTRDHEPFLLVEAKLSEREPSVPLKKFQQALHVPALQLIGTGSSAVPCILESQGDEKTFRRNWARLIQKIYEVDPLVCPKPVLSLSKDVRVPCGSSAACNRLTNPYWNLFSDGVGCDSR